MLKGDELKISEKPNDYKKFMDFLRTVQQNPSIVNSIREVKIIVSLDHDQSDKDIPWIFTCTPFHEFLLQLGAHNRVQYITISAMYDWTCFPKALSQALLGIFTNKSIQCVSLHYLSVPKDCFIHMARGGTPELHLSNMDILSSPHVATARGAQALMELHIEEMDSDSIGELIDALTPYIAPAPGRTNRYFPHLVDLTIGPTEAEQLPNYNQLVQASAFSLQILRWDYPASDFPEWPLSSHPISLMKHLHLREILYMIPDVNDAEDYHPNPFEGLIQLLDTINTERNSFAELKLKLICPHFSKIRDSLQSYDGWSQLALLLRHERFRSLERVTVRVFVLDPRTTSEIRHGADRLRVPLLPRKAILMELLEHRLPILARQDMLSLELSVPSILGSITV